MNPVEMSKVSKRFGDKAVLRNVSLVLVDGADHSFSNPIHMRPAVRDIAEYLERCLRNGNW